MMVGSNGIPVELDISFSGDISRFSYILTCVAIVRHIARNYVIPFLEASPEKEISNSSVLLVVLAIILVTFPQPVQYVLMYTG